MSVALALPDGRRLLDLFVRNRTALPREEVPLLAGETARRVGLVLRTLLVASILVLAVFLTRRSPWTGPGTG